MLVKAGFSGINLPAILECWFEGGDMYDDDYDCVMYYDPKTWGKTRGPDRRLPLCTAAVKSLSWIYTRKAFDVNMLAIYEVDKVTGLPLFMLAAVGKGSDIECVINLLKEYPSAINQ